MTEQSARSPLVSVVVTNFRLTDDVLTALDGVQAVAAADGVLVEAIVVDQASQGDSAERIRAHPSCPIVVVNEHNVGRSAGNMLGARSASGRNIAFLNPNAVPVPGWLRAALDELSADAQVACIASTVLDWDGQRIDSAGGELCVGLPASKRLAGESSTRSTVDMDVLFAPATSIIVRRELFDELGGFEDIFQNAGEDLDLGWRLWAAGHRVRLVARSVLRHRQHGVLDELGPAHRRYAEYRGAMIAIASVAEDGVVAQLLSPLMASAIAKVGPGFPGHGMFEVAPDDPARLRSSIAVPVESVATTAALNDAMHAMAGIEARRQRLRALRRRSDGDIFAAVGLRRDRPVPAGVSELARLLGSPPEGQIPRKVVVATVDVLSERMAGPAIRALEMARVLCAVHEVRLASHQPTTLDVAGIEVVSIRSESEMRDLEQWADVLIVQGYVMAVYPFLEHTDKPIVVDLYDPYHFEQLENQRAKPRWLADQEVANAVASLDRQIRRGDFFLCASEKQRDLWLGHLGAAGRVNPAVYRADESLRSLIDVVPFGLSATGPVQTEPSMRGVIDGIEEGDRIVLWAGGVYNWFDPLTLIRAVDLLRATVPDVRLVFMGMKHPNPDVAEMEVAVRAVELSAELRLTGTHVFFREGWVPYDRRQNFLLEADVGVSTHLMHLETAYSFRTRLLDYLWAGLPIVSTEGDGFAGVIRASGVGRVVPAEDPVTLANVLAELLVDDAVRKGCAQASRDLAARYTWEQALEPLMRFCRHPARSPDAPIQARPAERATEQFPAVTDEGPAGSRRAGLSRDVRTIARAISDDGMAGLAGIVRYKLGTLRSK